MTDDPAWLAVLREFYPGIFGQPQRVRNHYMPPPERLTRDYGPTMTPRTRAPDSRLETHHLKRDAASRTPWDLSIFAADTAETARDSREPAMTAQEIRDELVRLAERYKMDEGRRRVPMLDAARLNQAGNMPATPATPTPLTEADDPGNLVGRPTPDVGHNDFVERVRRNARPGPIGPQRPVPAIMGRRAEAPSPAGQLMAMANGYQDSIGPVVRGEAAVRPYEPSWRDRLAGMMMGQGRASPERRRFVEGLMGSTGLGTTGIGVADIVPGGQVLGAQEALRQGDYQGAALAVTPFGAGARGLRFNRSRLSEVPAVPQTELPRYTPARGIPERSQDVISDPALRDQMLETIQRGKEMGGADWYNAEPLREKFLSTLGKREGEESFGKYMDFVAATSPRSKVPENVRNASYYYSLAKQGEPMPAVGTPNPAPYGHLAQKLHQRNAAAVAGPGWDPLQNPKPASFAQNLTGNQAPVTVDTHAFRLPAILRQDPRFLETAYQASKGAPKQNIQKMVQSGRMPMKEAVETPAYWQAQPRENEYAALEQYYKGLGRELDLSPAQTQASAWVGGGKITGLASDETKPFIGFLEDRVRYTAQQRGLSENEVLQRFIKGKEPLLALPVAALPAAAALREDQQ